MLSTPSPDPTRRSSISRVCVMGGSGLLGEALCEALGEYGISVSSYSRNHVAGDRARAHWNPDLGEIDKEPLVSADAVVNLAGESLVAGRWNQARKERLVRSRIDSTQFLARTLAQLDHKPSVLINASAVGFYGDRGEEAVTEQSPPGHGFLADLCRAWEDAARPAEQAGIRVVQMRLGVVLAKHGGALHAMMPLFRAGLGGKLGSGQQYFPWVTLHDAVRAIKFLLVTSELAGPVNLVAPEPTRNTDFTEALSEVLGRPALLPVPKLALRLALGEAADQVLLSGANVRPAVLEQAGFRFDYPRLMDALQAVLSKSRT